MTSSPVRLHRLSKHLGPLFVCFIVALAMLAPYAGDRLRESTASDLSVHCSAIIEATRALHEGQFPIRVAPSHPGGVADGSLGGVRFPLFQFYGQFPYTAAALICVSTGATAFTAWKLVQLIALTLGGFYVYRTGARATRRRRASVVAAVVFMTAPYMWADLHARFAFPELVSFNLLPVVMFYASRAFATRRWGHVLLGGIAWSLLALSHNITFLYASALLGLYFLSHTAPNIRFVRRIARVGLAYALGLLLTVWYHAPQYDTVPLLNIRVASDDPRPTGADTLTPLNVLLAPALKTPPGSTTERLGLQVGWPSLAAVVLAAVSLSWNGRNRRRVLRLIVFTLIAFVIAWSPPAMGGFDLWRFIPDIFAYVQSSYRILMFVALFAALLVPYALAWEDGLDLPAWATLIVLAGVGGAAFSYVPSHERLPPDALDKLIAHPLLDGLKDYLIAPDELARTSRPAPEGQSEAFMPAAAALSSTQRGATSHYSADFAHPTLVQLPILFYPHLLRVTLDGDAAPYGNVGPFVAIDMPASRHTAEVAFVGVRWANWISAIAWLLTLTTLAVCGVRKLRHIVRLPSVRVRRHSGESPFPAAWEGVVAAGVLFGILGTLPAREAIARHLYVPLECTATSSRPSDPAHPPAYAFDAEETTSWAVPGGGEPVTLKIEPATTKKFSRMIFTSRRSGLWESWHKVKVVMYLRGEVVFAKEFRFTDAQNLGVHEIHFKDTRANRIELTFSEAVTLTRDGQTQVDPNGCSPGYAEIRID